MTAAPETKPWTHYRAKIASLHAHGCADDAPELAEAHRGLNTAQRAKFLAELEMYIRRVVDAAPPLTAQQRDRLTALLHAGAPDA